MTKQTTQERGNISDTAIWAREIREQALLILELRKEVESLAKNNRHSVINFVDFCIEKEGKNRQSMEIAYMHFIKSRGV